MLIVAVTLNYFGWEYITTVQYGFGLPRDIDQPVIERRCSDASAPESNSAEWHTFVAARLLVRSLLPQENYFDWEMEMHFTSQSRGHVFH